jgi:hypothetical protein
VSAVWWAIIGGAAVAGAVGWLVAELERAERTVARRYARRRRQDEDEHLFV